MSQESSESKGKRRSFAGYMCEETLSVGLFGECMRGQKQDGTEARIVIVEERLAKRRRFATALARHSSGLAELVHPHIVTTRTVGRGKDGGLIVIASPVDDPHNLSSILETSEGRLPQPVAVSIAVGALRGLSYAHEHGVIHGGMHPRSVVIDKKGIVKLADFGLAHALASAAAAAEDSELLAGLRGYVAPELALGQDPDLSSDVFAAGSLISHVVWGAPSPPDGEDSKLADVVRKAISTDAAKRFTDACKLEHALRPAVDEMPSNSATAGEIATFVSRLGKREATLDAETEDVLASLEADLGLAGPRQSTALKGALAGLEEDFLGLEDSVDGSFPLPPAAMSADDGSDFDDDDDDEHTRVDRDDQEMNPADHVEAVIRHGAPESELVAMTPTADYGDGETAKPLQVSEVLDLSAPAEPVPDFAPLSSVTEDVSLSGGGNLRWIAVIVFVLGLVFAVAYTKTDFFNPGRRAAEEKNQEAANQAALEELVRKQPQPGEIVVSSETEDAAVWLFLGHTPATSFRLPSSSIHEIRIDHEGFQSVHMNVAAQHWAGDETQRKALLSVSLLPKDESTVDLPAFPPEPNPPLAPGGKGQGIVVVESEPAGAEVWMRIGETPEMRMSGIEAGKDYRFKVLKDGFLPAFAEVKESDWYLTGSSGPIRPSLSRTVSLTALPAPESKGKDKRKSKRRRRKGRRR